MGVEEKVREIVRMNEKITETRKSFEELKRCINLIQKSIDELQDSKTRSEKTINELKEKLWKLSLKEVERENLNKINELHPKFSQGRPNFRLENGNKTVIKACKNGKWDGLVGEVLLGPEGVQKFAARILNT